MLTNPTQNLLVPLLKRSIQLAKVTPKRKIVAKVPYHRISDEASRLQSLHNELWQPLPNEHDGKTLMYMINKEILLG